MNGGANAFGSANRANATIGRAVRLMMLNVGGAWPGDLDKSTLGHPGKYTYCVAENEAQSPLDPYHVEHGYKPEASTVFAIAAEDPPSATNHVSNDAEGIDRKSDVWGTGGAGRVEQGGRRHIKT